MADTDTDTKPDALPTEVVLHGAQGNLKIRFVVPQSMGIRYEVTYAIAKSEAKACCAALGLCSSAIRQHVRWDHDVMAFGAGVLEWLLSEGVAYLDVLAAGRIAWANVSAGLISKTEVDETEGFSEPSTDGSTG